MIVVSMLEARIQVALGRPGRHPRVQALYSVPYDRLLGDAWEQALDALWHRYSLPRKGICLIPPWEEAVTRVLTLPNMMPKQLGQAVRHELQPSGDGEVVTDYLPLSREEKLLTVLGGACRLPVLERYIQGFEGLGLELDRVSVPLEGPLKLLSATEEMRDKTCLWLLFDGGVVVSLLAERGNCRYAGRGRVFSRPGTEDFGREVAGVVSGAIQFQSAKQQTGPITHVYFGGCPEEGFAPCVAGIRALGPAVEPLPLCRRFRAFPEGEALGDWADCVGSFLRI